MASPVLVGGSGRPILRNGRPLSTCGAVKSGVQTSASATTIWANWTTGSAADTVLSCGTSPGTFNIAAADAGTQTSVTAHSGIIAGLTPNTRYYCRATSGGAEVARWEIVTQAAPATTPLTGCSFSANTKAPLWPGDTFHNCIARDGTTYVTACDSPGSGGVQGASNTGGPMILGKLTNEATFASANVNVLPNFLAANVGGTQSPKLSGIFADGGYLYGAMAQQKNSVVPYEQHGGQIIKSDNYGLRWSNFQATNTYVTDGAVTSPSYANMFSGGTANGDQQMASPAFCMYGPDDGTLGYRVDNADAYAYVISNDGFWDNGSKLFLSRVAKAKLPNLSGSDYQYFTGGDGSLDTNWSASFASAASLIGTQLGKIGLTTIQYLPTFNRYVMLTWYYPSTSDTSATVWVTYEAAHPWGPWTAINTTNWTGFGWYNPSVLMRSALQNLAAFPLTLMFSGNYAGSGAGPYYNLNTCKMTLQT